MKPHTCSKRSLTCRSVLPCLCLCLLGAGLLIVLIPLAITQAAATLKIDTIAEHVETEAIAEKLRELGVTYGQGYYFSQPVAIPSGYDDVAAVPAAGSAQAR